MNTRKRIIFDDITEGDDFVVTYNKGYSEIDDSFDETQNEEIILTAPNIELAMRYAQQYLRKLQTEEETSEEWANAEIVSIEQY